MGTQRFAVIDIGTVTCRLLIADVSEEGINELLRRSSIVNLGEDVDATGVLKPEAMQRTCKVIASYVEDIARFESEGNAIDVAAIATSASRDAHNADEFVAMLAELGITLTVIPGEREAALSFLGASSAYPGERLLVTDVGGGSSELIYGIGGENPIKSHSFNIGCRRMTERFLAGDPPTEEECTQAREWARAEFEIFFRQLADEGLEIDRMVSVAGTATTIVSVYEALDPYDASVVNGYQVSEEELAHVRERLSAMTLDERLTVTGLQPGRAPVIVAGTLIMQELVDLAGAGGYTASDNDILHGLAVDAYNRKNHLP